MTSFEIEYTLVPEDWEYLAEGKIHAVFKFVGNTNEFLDKILRIPKTNCTVENDEEKDENIKVRTELDMHKIIEESQREIIFLQNVIVPVIGNEYIDHGVRINLSDSFVNALNVKLTFANRPPKRREYNLDCAIGFGILHKNQTTCIRSFPFSTKEIEILSSSDRKGKRFAIELKVKTGCLSNSHFVGKENRIKYEKERFWILQAYKEYQKKLGVEPDWGIFDKKSLYSPQSIFSLDPIKMQSSLCEAFKCPQNTMRIFVEGKPVFGWKFEVESNDTRKEWKQFFEAEFSIEKSSIESETTIFKFLSTLLAGLLKEESLLPRLLYLQSLNIIDIEGAEVIFNRLLSLCNDSKENAFSLLETWENIPISFSNRFFENLHVFAPVSTELKIQNDFDFSKLSNKELDMYKENAIRCASQLSKEDCLELLHYWLIALGASDCSIMISFQNMLPVVDNINNKKEEYSLLKNIFTQNVLKGHGKKILSEYHCIQQTNESCGVIGKLSSTDSSATDTDTDLLYAYDIRIVDVGPKPSSKILSKLKLENVIVESAKIRQQIEEEKGKEKEEKENVNKK